MFPSHFASLHPDLLALLASCRAAPADDTPRLVLADWLDENADSAGVPVEEARTRAQFIRVQVELARPTYETGHLAQLRATEARLLTANAAQWLGNLPWRLTEYRKQPFGFAAHQVVSHSAPTYNPLATNDGWRFSRGLLTVELNPEEIEDATFAEWFASPSAAWVDEVRVELAGLEALGRLRVPDSMRPYLGVRYVLGTAADRSMHLVTPRAPRLNKKRCREVFHSANFSLVRSLRLDATAIGAGALALLVDAGGTELRQLAIKGPISDTSAAFLARVPLENLSALEVSGCDLSADGFRLIVNSPHLRQLVSLSAFRNRFGCDGLIALAAAPLAGRLNVLELQNTGVGDRGVAALTNSSLLERLVGPGLNLSMNPITDVGVEALAKCEHLAPFSELILRDCRIGDRGARALANSARVANLTYLDLWKNRIGDVGARALADSPHLGNMRELSIRDNSITASGTSALQARFGDRVRV